MYSMKVKVKSLSHVRLFATQWTVAHQAPLSMGFSRQEYWSGLPCPPPGDLSYPGIAPMSLRGFFTTSTTCDCIRFTSNISVFFQMFCFFWPWHMTCRILAPWPGIRLGPSAVNARNPNKWTDRKFLCIFHIFILCIILQFNRQLLQLFFKLKK